MRKIPVTLHNDQVRVVGHIAFTDAINPEELKNCHFAWLYDLKKNEVIGATLIPKLKVGGDDDSRGDNRTTSP